MNGYLNPIFIDTPPEHCIVDIACDKCDKRAVCSVSSDYRKVATLIQNILGDTQLDRELLFCDCGFTGFEFKDITIFPTEYEIKPKNETEIKGTFLNARYRNEDKIKLLLKIEDYFVLFILEWDSSFEKWTVKLGKELIYGITYELSDAALETLQEPLTTWRTAFIEEKEKSTADIINTTPFSAILRCKYYSPIIKNPRKTNYVNHNIGEGYRHIATFHKEDAPVTEAYDTRTMIGYYPWFVPAPHMSEPPKPPRRRDDQ